LDGIKMHLKWIQGVIHVEPKWNIGGILVKQKWKFGSAISVNNVF
jgi:hypothetical protein